MSHYPLFRNLLANKDVFAAMQTNEPRLQFGAKELLFQTVLVGLALALFVYRRDNGFPSPGDIAALSTITGAIIGGCFGNFKIGAAMASLAALPMWVGFFVVLLQAFIEAVLAD